MEKAHRTTGPRVLLSLLLLCYIFNFLDRTIVNILAESIIDDLELTDAQFGAITGLAFAILYSVCGVPLAMLADRTSRSRVIAGSLAVWSGFTALCGLATNFWQMFIFRLGVGVGEAGGVAPSYALIADYFPPARRARALAIFSLGIPLGLTFGTLIGAYLAAWINWRAAFIVMGVAGIVLAPVMLYFVRDKPRTATVHGQSGPARQTFPTVARKPTFWLMAIAASLSSIAGYGLAAWTPSILARSFDMGLIERGQFLAAIFLIGGTAGVFAGGWLADRLGQRDRSWYARIPCHRLAPHRSAVRGRPSRARGMDGLVPAAHPQRPQHPVARAGDHRRPAPRSFSDARDRFGELPDDQQSHWPGCRPDADRGLSELFRERLGTEALRYAAVSVVGFYVLASILMFFAIKRLSRTG
jgi:predicted MFS family arabinose efflux permease